MLKGVSLGCCCASRGVPEPVVGDALRSVAHRDGAALAESEGVKRTPHRDIVLVGVAAQVIRVLSRELEDSPTNTAPPYRGHAVNDVVIGIRAPSAVDLGIGFIRPGSEREDGEGPLVGYEKAVPARDVFLSVNAARMPVGPLGGVPIRGSS